MTRIDSSFEALKANGKKAFVAFIMGGDPNAETSLAVMKGLPAAGVDIIELGMPFTDPMADGGITTRSMRWGSRPLLRQPMRLGLTG